MVVKGEEIPVTDIDRDRKREVESEIGGRVESEPVEVDSGELDRRIGGVEEVDCSGEEENGGGGADVWPETEASPVARRRAVVG